MNTQPEAKSVDLEMARDDLEARTLARIPGDFARLIYLASTRDYNNGQYYHAGLARQFSDEAARIALSTAHRNVFRRLVLCSVNQLAEELDVYVQSTRLPLYQVVHAWKQLQPYRIAIPLECSPLTARFFATNVMAALEILETRQADPHPARPRSASRQQ